MRAHRARPHGKLRLHPTCRVAHHGHETVRACPDEVVIAAVIAAEVIIIVVVVTRLVVEQIGAFVAVALADHARLVPERVFGVETPELVRITTLLGVLGEEAVDDVADRVVAREHADRLPALRAVGLALQPFAHARPAEVVEARLQSHWLVHKVAADRAEQLLGDLVEVGEPPLPPPMAELEPRSRRSWRSRRSRRSRSRVPLQTRKRRRVLRSRWRWQQHHRLRRSPPPTERRLLCWRCAVRRAPRI